MTPHKANQYKEMIRNLAVHSQIRGSVSSGICALIGNEYHMYKAKLPSTALVKTKEYKRIVDMIRPGTKFKALIGHTRHPTKGSALVNYNNHPIIADKVIGVHNGVISNDEYLFRKYRKYIDRAGEVDSEIIFRLIDMYSDTLSLVSAVQATTEDLWGGYACAFFHTEYPDYVTLFKEGQFGGIAVFNYKVPRTMAFASTDGILKKATNGLSLFRPQMANNRIEVGGDKGMRVNLSNGKLKLFDINSGVAKKIGRYGSAEAYFEPTRLGEAVYKGKCMAYTHGLLAHNSDVCNSICSSCDYFEKERSDV
jgi:hypothetical protein